MSRELLGRAGNIATRERVYRVEGALEVDEIDHYEVRRSRVFFDDVVLVTLHRYRGVAVLLITGAAAVLLGAASLAVGMTNAVAGWTMFAIMGGPFLIAFLFRLFFPFTEINVYSRRTQARLRYFRTQHAQRIFEDILSDVRQAQLRTEPAGESLDQPTTAEPPSAASPHRAE